MTICQIYDLHKFSMDAYVFKLTNDTCQNEHRHFGDCMLCMGELRKNQKQIGAICFVSTDR